jgi:heme A synthase
MVLQFFFAGLGVFRVANFGPHRSNGDLLIVATFILLILAGASYLTGNLARGRVGLAALLFVLMLIQALLASDSVQGGAPVISALHPVNGLLLLAISYALARGSRPFWEAQRETAEGNLRR